MIESVTATRDGWTVMDVHLGITGCGRTLRAACRDLSDTIRSLWLEFSATPDEQLAPDAIELRERIFRHVRFRP